MKTMLYVIQWLQDGGEIGAMIELPKGKAITLGAAVDADLRLTPYFRLPDVCVRIWHDDHCIAENMARKDSLVSLNGQPLYSVAQLEDGDVLQIGVDRFKVSCREVISVSPVKTQQSMEKSAAARIDYTLNSTVVNSAVSRHAPLDSKWTQNDLLKQLFAKKQTILFANFRVAGVDPPGPDVAGPDHYKDAPAEVRDMYSLHAITGGTPEQKLLIVESLRGKDAVVVALPESDPATCLAESKKFWAWFARPSVLGFTLTQGSRELCEKLLKPFQGLLIQPKAQSAEWVVYSKAGTKPEDLALPILEASRN